MIYVRATLAAIIAISAVANAPTADATWFFGPPAKTPCPTTAAPKSYSASQFQLPFNWFGKVQTAATPCPTTAAPVTKAPVTQMAVTPCPKTLAPTAKASAKTPAPTTKAPVKTSASTPSPDPNVKQVGY